MRQWFSRRYLDLLGSIYIYNEHRGYTAIDRVLEAVRERWPDDHVLIARIEKHRADERKHYMMFRRWFERRGFMLAWESFGAGWVTDVAKQLKLDADIRTADYGEICDLGGINPASDIVFTWNGTTSGVRVPDADWIRADRTGLSICDATSAAFAQRIDWDKVDVGTFSWQKALGGEAAHGMLFPTP